MSAKGTRVGQRGRQRMAEGQRRKRKSWLGGLAILSPHIRAFERSGRVHHSLRPAFNASLAIVGAYTLDLDPEGGNSLTAGESLVLMKLQRALVISGAMFEKFAASGDPAILEGASVWLREEQWALAQLGLKRRPRGVSSLQEYLAERSKGDARTLDVAASAPCGAEDDPQVEADADRSGERVDGDEAGR